MVERTYKALLCFESLALDFSFLLLLRKSVKFIFKNETRLAMLVYILYISIHRVGKYDFCKPPIFVLIYGKRPSLFTLTCTSYQRFEST